MGGAAVAVLMLLAAQSSVPAAPPPTPDLPVSVDHIREGLQRPVLKIPPIDPTPVFRATVEADAPFDNPLQGMRRELAEDPGTPLECGPCNVLPLVMGIVRSIKAAHRAHVEAEVRKEVQAALDAFCAEHDCSVLSDGPPPMEGIVLPRKRPTQ
jgi:hypothetical protein